MNYPILMADILQSSERNSKTLIAEFKSMVAYFNKKHRATLLSPLTITLGDEFQGIIDTIENGIKLLFEIEEFIIKKEYGFKLRFVLNYGRIDTEVNKKKAYEMLGPGLTESRKILNSLKTKESRFWIHTSKKSASNLIINKAFVIYQSFTDSWNIKDLKIVTEFLAHKDYKKVAEIIGIDPSSAWRRKKSLKINEYIYIRELILFISR
ncbi:MAG: hypothetical protein H7321_06520 [Bacteroidia bacterium]|nr:hypothetical protein [Bacteroidia bacterium]